MRGGYSEIFALQRRLVEPNHSCPITTTSNTILEDEGLGGLSAILESHEVCTNHVEQSPVTSF